MHSRARIAGAIAALGLLAIACPFPAAQAAPPPGSEVRNLAFGAPATQSSTEYGSEAARAVDGNRNGNYSGNSVTHTASEVQPYWQTDLGQSKKINKITVYNRTDCCTNRLSNFWVLASDSPITARSLSDAKNQSGVTATRIGTLNGASVDVPQTRNARYLRIQLEGTDYLSLAEVQVFGDEVISPSPAAQQWVKNSNFGMFLHYNMSTYTNSQWADPNAPESGFNPTAMDAKQWATSIKNAGMKFGVLTAKHHDGFALWDSAYSTHDIAACPYKNGKGDIIREYVNAMRAKNLKVGLYFSIWDRHNGDSRELVENQLRELLTKYGPIDYLWFDGWGWQVPYSKVPYQPVRDMIHEISPAPWSPTTITAARCRPRTSSFTRSRCRACLPPPTPVPPTRATPWTPTARGSTPRPRAPREPPTTSWTRWRRPTPATPCSC